VVLVTLGMVALANVANAQWRVDVSGGALVDPSPVHLPVQRPAGARAIADFDDGGSYALGAAYAIGNHFELGGQFQHALSRQAHRLRLPGGPFSTTTATANPALDVFSVTVGGRVHLLPPERRVRPWLVGQLGWYRATAEVDERTGPPSLSGCVPHCPLAGLRLHHSGSDDGLGVNVGGGVDVALNQLISVGIDVRWHRLFNLLDHLSFLTTMASLSFHF